MDSEFIVSGVQPGEVQCILCADVINFNKGNHQDKFFGHMKNHHNISINHILLFGIHFMDDHSVGQIIDNFKQDYYNIVNMDIGDSDGDSFENGKLLYEQDFDNIGDQIELSKTTKFSDQSLSSFVKQVVESPLETCEECKNEFNVRYKKCIFHKDIPSQKRKYSTIYALNTKDDRSSKSRKMIDINSIISPIKLTVAKEDFKSIDNPDCKQFNCDMCDEHFNLKRSLIRHKSSFHGITNRYTCDICDFKTKHEGNLRRHTKNVHNKNSTLNQGKSVNNSNIFEDEKLLDQDHNDQIEEFHFEELLDDHGQIEDASIAGPIDGDIIEDGNKRRDKQVKQKITLGLGINGERKWQCTDCDYYHKSKTNTINHIEAKHLEEKVFCKLCNASFNARNYLKMHLKEKHRDSEKHDQLLQGLKEFKTNYNCNYERYGEESMDENIDSRRMIEPKTEADNEDANKKRDKAVKQKMILGVGLQGEKMWKCTECNYSHKKTNNVVDHIEARHLNELVFCKLCNMSFSTRKCLKRHLKEKHRDSEKPFMTFK